MCEDFHSKSSGLQVTIETLAESECTCRMDASPLQYTFTKLDEIILLHRLPTGCFTERSRCPSTRCAPQRWIRSSPHPLLPTPALLLVERRREGGEEREREGSSTMGTARLTEQGTKRQAQEERLPSTHTLRFHFYSLTRKERERERERTGGQALCACVGFE